MMKKKIRLVAADSQPLILEGIRRMVASQADLEMVGGAADGRELLRLVKKLKPDLVLLDLSMPNLDGLEALPLLKEALPTVGVVVLSTHDKETYVQQTLAAGALGYVLKTDSDARVLEALRLAAAGQYFISPSLREEVIKTYLNSTGREEVPETSAYDTLTAREQQVFRLVVGGRISREIAATLGISPRTVEKHRANIIRKLEVRDTSAMIRYAIKVGVVDPDLWDH